VSAAAPERVPLPMSRYTFVQTSGSEAQRDEVHLVRRYLRALPRIKAECFRPAHENTFLGRERIIAYHRGDPRGVLAWSQERWDTSRTGVDFYYATTRTSADLLFRRFVATIGHRHTLFEPWLAGPAPSREELERLGFGVYQRTLLVSTAGPAENAPPPQVTFSGNSSIADCANVLRRAYDLHIDGQIYPFLTNQAACLRYVQHTLQDSSALISSGTLTAIRNGTTVGFVACAKSASSPYAYVVQLVVDPGEARQGIGSALISEVLARTLRSGYRGLMLTVTNGNHGAIRMYRRMAFKSVSREAAWTRSGDLRHSVVNQGPST